MEIMLPSVTTAKVPDTWPENAKLQENAITARRSVTSQETAQKEETERRTLSATNVTKTDILPEIAKVIFSITFRLSRLNEVNSKPKRTEDMIFFIFHSKQFLFF